jgi:hypothetical protein
MTVEQYNILLAAAPLLESALAKKNVQTVRPDYDADLNAVTETPEVEDAETEDKDDDEHEEAVGKVNDDEEEED